MHWRMLVYAGTMAMIAGACPVEAGDEDALRRLHEKVIRAHQENKVELLLEDEAEEYVVANRGEVTRPTIDDRRTRLGSYLQRTLFSEYRDVVEPVVKVSADGSLGWVITKVHVRGRQAVSGEAEEELEFTCAWIELYEKRKGRWYRIGNLSNFKE